jgi:hypothetical protein
MECTLPQPHRTEMISEGPPPARATHAQNTSVQSRRPHPVKASPERRAAYTSLFAGLAQIGMHLFRTASTLATEAAAAVRAGAAPPAVHPLRRFIRLQSVMVRLIALLDRLQQDKPLPDRLPIPAPKTPDTQAASPKPLKPKRSRKPLSPAAEEARAQRRIASNIERLLQTRNLRQILTLFCRQLGVPADPEQWPDVPEAVPEPNPATPQAAEPHHAPAPPIRPGPAADPPAPAHPP